jgi:RNA-directed DNA polymerase
MTAAATLVRLQAQIHREARAAGGAVDGLMPWLLDRRLLDAAWDRVRQTDGALTPGVDGVTCADLEHRPQPWLAKLAADLLHDRYRPAPPRWVEIPKPGSDATRRLGILTVRDRLVHAALKLVLEPVLEPLFHAHSFGFRPGRSVAGALAEAARRLAADTPDAVAFACGVHLDVADCFPTIDHALLREQFARHVADDAVRRLLGHVLDAGATTVRRWWRSRRVGLIQGSALSPLLCNLYLHPLDEALAQLGAATQNGVLALRYADDLLLLARDTRLGRQAVAATRQALAGLRLRLRDPHAVPGPVAGGLTWLGVHLRPRPERWTGKVRFGYVVPDDKVRAMLDRLNEMTAPPSARLAAAVFDLGRWIVSLNEQLRDWHQAYVFADNAAEVFRALDEHALQRVKDLLFSLTGTRGHALFDRYRVRLPRGFWTWEVNGCRLVVLSALAPRRPYRLTRRPPWLAHVRDDEGKAAPPRKPAARPRPAPPHPAPQADRPADDVDTGEPEPPTPAPRPAAPAPAANRLPEAAANGASPNGKDGPKE